MLCKGASSHPSFHHHHTHHLVKETEHLNTSSQIRNVQNSVLAAVLNKKATAQFGQLPSKETGPTPGAKFSAFGWFFNEISKLLKASIWSISSTTSVIPLLEPYFCQMTLMLKNTNYKQHHIEKPPKYINKMSKRPFYHEIHNRRHVQEGNYTLRSNHRNRKRI